MKRHLYERKSLDGFLPLTEDNLEKVKTFVFQKWKERANDFNLSEPDDLSNSCKYSSLFVRHVFGGQLAGNSFHQFVVKDGKILDINIDAKDVKSLTNPHYHSEVFWGNHEHQESLDSCKPRVEKWVAEFKSLLNIKEIKNISKKQHLNKMKF
jgi:hypothetical protein